MKAAAPGHYEGQRFGAIASQLVRTQFTRRTRAELGRGDSPRTGQPVWRNSYYVGQIEKQIWRPINGGGKRGGKRFTSALLKGAKALELRTRAERREKEPGARNGVLGEVGIAVLEYLYHVVDFDTGRLEPAIRTIATEIGRAYSAVHEAIKRLRDKGFLQWMRRSQPVENPEPGGPMVKQASNAYALLVPDAMQEWMRRLIGGAPTPACEEDRQRQKKQELERMLAGMSATDYAADFVRRDSLAGEVLWRIAAAIERSDACTANPAGAMKPGDHTDP